MNDQQIREVITAWLDGKEIECWCGDELRLTVKFPNLPRLTYRWRINEPKLELPPRPSEEQLLDWGVRIAGDVPRVPKKGEQFCNGDATDVFIEGESGWVVDRVYGGLRWIVGPDPYAEAKKAWQDGELQYESFHGGWKDWLHPDINWNAFSPCALRRKPKEPQGKWVECEVFERDGWCVFNALNPFGTNYQIPIDNAQSIKGFGGYLYDGRWSLRMKSENNPPTNGAVIRKPDAVRFWVTEGGK